jgi:pimeloyl-ACP methyl ester carboxylesterase
VGEAKRTQAGVLDVGFEEHGDARGWPVVLLHGFPYDVRAYDGVAPILASAGARVIVPYLRGYGPTRFLSPGTPRSGQQAALAADLLALLDALAIEKAVVAGFDWGGRAACLLSALFPERVAGLVTQNGYNVLDVGRSLEPADPEFESRLWYVYYFHSERGRLGLARNRNALCELLWRTWSPNWRFDRATFETTASSFANPDFVDVVIHSYRHRFALTPGDPQYADLEARIATQPNIGVPTIAIDGEGSGIWANVAAGHARKFTGRYEVRNIPLAGHNTPAEAPEAFAQAILDLRWR